MTLVFVNNSDETYTPTHSGAIGTFVHECCRAADRAGVEAVVVTRPPKQDGVVGYRAPRVEMVEFPGVAGGFGRFMARARKKLTGWRDLGQEEYAGRVARRIDALGLGRATLVLHNDPEMAATLAERFREARVLHHFHNHLAARPGWRGRVARVRMSAVSNFTARWVEREYGVAAGGVRTVYNAVDGEQFSPGAGGGERPVVFNFVGRTGVEKAPDLLLRAALRLDRGGFAVQVVGSNHFGRWTDDPYQQELAGLAAQLEARGVEVRRPGHVGRAELPGYFRRADVHVVPSRWDEPFGLTTLEGMSSGLAVIASETGGTPEVVGDAGLMFPRDDAAALAARMGELLEDAPRRRTLAAAARARAATFSWDATLAGLVRAAVAA